MLPQLDIAFYPSQIFWLILFFSILYFVTAKYTIPRIERIRKMRNEVIEEDIKQAEILSTQIRELKQKYNHDLQEILRKITAEQNLTKEQIEKKISAVQYEFKIQSSEQLEIIKQETNDYLITLYQQQKQETCIFLANILLSKILGQQPNMNLLQSCYKQVNK